MLEQKGVVLTEKISFPDHYAYKREEVERLIKKGVPVLTTRKDAVKIDVDLQQKLTIVDVIFMFDEPEKWKAFWERKMK